MFKKITVLTVAAVLLLSLFACAKEGVGEPAGTEAGTEAETKDVAAEPVYADLAKLREDMVSEFGIEVPMDIAVDTMYGLYGTEPADVADHICFVTIEYVFPQEIIVIRAADDAAAGRLAVQLQKKLEAFRVQSKDYDAENYALAQKCEVITDGLYVALFLSPHHEAMTEMFREAIKN